MDISPGKLKCDDIDKKKGYGLTSDVTSFDEFVTNELVKAVMNGDLPPDVKLPTKFKVMDKVCIMKPRGSNSHGVVTDVILSIPENKYEVLVERFDGTVNSVW